MKPFGWFTAVLCFPLGGWMHLKKPEDTSFKQIQWDSLKAKRAGWLKAVVPPTEEDTAWMDHDSIKASVYSRRSKGRLPFIGHTVDIHWLKASSKSENESMALWFLFSSAVLFNILEFFPEIISTLHRMFEGVPKGWEESRNWDLEAYDTLLTGDYIQPSRLNPGICDYVANFIFRCENCQLLML